MFFGTSNDYTFLKDMTGNRRFWPVDVGVNEPTKSIWNDMPKEVDQIWAEAVMYYQLGEPLHMSKELEKLAQAAQNEHREMSEKEGLIMDFLDRQIPESWSKVSVRARKAFWANPVPQEGVTLVERKRVCAAEIWVECLNGDLKYLKRSESSEINNILSNIPNWERESTGRHGPYGTQKGFKKV